MSHTVVVTTTTTTTTSTPDGGFCNLGYARSFQGLLKIGQVVRESYTHLFYEVNVYECIESLM